MKLYNVPNNTYIRLLQEGICPPDCNKEQKDTVLLFNHIDGMYSVCKDKYNNIVHLVAWTEVEPLNEEEYDSVA